MQDLIADALRHRADLVESRIQLNTTEISNKAVRNALLPTLDLFAYYGGSGVGGDIRTPAFPSVFRPIRNSAIRPHKCSASVPQHHDCQLSAAR